MIQSRVPVVSADHYIHDVLNDSFTGLYKLPCWNASQGFGSYLTFEFGDPRLEISERKENCITGFYSKRRATVLGSWRLWIKDCFWELESDNRSIHSESSREEISVALHGLSGEALQKVTIDADLGTSAFVFDFGSILKTKPNLALDSDGQILDNWVLFEPNGFQFVYRADGKYSHELDGADNFK